ncbi:MAG: putative bifunctional diguanylate cyclase/phosphodiesterase [Acidimicrobiia bacterium]
MADAARRPVWHRRELPVVAVLAGFSVAMALGTPTVVRVAGALALLAMAAAVALDRDPTVLRGRVVAAVGLTVLTLADAGLPGTADLGFVVEGTLWRPVAAVVAYPVLGRALLLTVGRYRLFKATDLLVEAALIGAAGAIALQVVVNRLTSSGGWEPAAPVLASLLVGLDIALAVVVARPLTSTAARRAPVVLVASSIAALLAGHLVAALHLATGGSAGLLATAPIAAALLAIGGGALYDALTDRPAIIPVEAPLFSGAHAGIVVVAVIAAPVVLALQVAWDVSISGAVAVGAGLIGVVLAVHIVSLLQERAESEHQATHDVLTGLPNRLLFTDRLERAIAHAERNDVPVGVLFIDLDRFKDVNDTFGHAAGDRLLRETARRLAECARHEDTVARLAGDEFAVLLPHLRAADDVSLVANRILEALRDPIELGDVEVHSIGSIGVAVFPHDGSTPAELLSAADAAMYRAKDRGGAAVELFSAELHAQAATRLELETALHHAIHHDELVLYYQPIVEAGTGRTCGAESLVRWIHPERGMVPPGEFIPVAEQSDLIIELGDWVIRTACEQLAAWAQQGFGDRFITVNVSPRHFRADLPTAITRSLRETGADPTRLVVELTETAAVDDVALVAARLRELRQLGVKAAIDDFGTGYCGLQYLGDLPVSTLKLDRSFVQSMTPSNAAIVAATIAMTRTLGLTMVAEGVETEEQRRFLESQGCDRLQGYHLGRPMPAEELAERLREEDRAAAAATRPPAVPPLLSAPAPGVAASHPVG